VANAASIVAWSQAAAVVVLAGQVTDTAGAAVTVNVSMHVTLAPQSSVAVKVTVVAPPHAAGAPVLLLLTEEALQPAEVVAVPNQVAKAALIAACVWQEASVAGAGQLITNGAATVYPNIAGLIERATLPV